MSVRRLNSYFVTETCHKIYEYWLKRNIKFVQMKHLNLIEKLEQARMNVNFGFIACMNYIESYKLYILEEISFLTESPSKTDFFYTKVQIPLDAPTWDSYNKHKNAPSIHKKQNICSGDIEIYPQIYMYL